MATRTKNTAEEVSGAIAEPTAEEASVAIAEPIVDVLNLASFEDALRVFESVGVVETETYEITDKAELVNVPFIITEWKYGKEMKYGETPWVVCEGITKDDKRFLFTDGSTGIAQQLVDILEAKGRSKGILVGRGLVRSDYTYMDESGKEIPATTYYLS